MPRLRRFFPQISRRSLDTSLVLLLIFALPVSGQTAGSWQVAVGAGVSGDGHVVLGEFGRTIYAFPRVEFSALLTAGHVETGNLVCTNLDGDCDLRELSTFGALSFAATTIFRRNGVSPYIRASVGAWSGRDSDVGLYQSSHEKGRMLTGEVGARVQMIELGFCAHGLYGVRRQTIGAGTVIARLSF